MDPGTAVATPTGMTGRESWAFAMGTAVLLSAACARTSDPGAACPRGENCPAATAEVRAQPLRAGPQAVPPGPAQGRGAGLGGGPCTFASGTLPEGARAAIERALAEERRAEADYRALLASSGDAPPLRHIARAEARHAFELERLLLAHGATVPASPTPPSAAATAATRREACVEGASSERRNVALYDELLATPLPGDVRCVFERLRSASANRHLPAFERCAF